MAVLDSTTKTDQTTTSNIETTTNNFKTTTELVPEATPIYNKFTVSNTKTITIDELNSNTIEFNTVTEPSVLEVNKTTDADIGLASNEETNYEKNNNNFFSKEAENSNFESYRFRF